MTPGPAGDGAEAPAGIVPAPRRPQRSAADPRTYRIARRIGVVLLALLLVVAVAGLVLGGVVGWWSGVVGDYLDWLPFLGGRGS